MAKFRSWSSFSCKNSNFIMVACALILCYALLVYQFFIREGKDLFLPWFYIITFFHLMTIWSYIAVVVTDPGSVPIYWGIYSQQNNKQRIYCLKCHNFKPERSHHCSKCEKCILNMDHHCPWINNCVGFQNRKHFLLFLFYILVTIILSLIPMIIIEVNEIKLILSGSIHPNLHTALRLVLIIVFLTLVFTLSMFLFMHFKFVMNNSTTIEQLVLERKKKAAENREVYFQDINEENQFNIDCYYNFTQVFGQNPICWFFPIQNGNNLKGKGVYWLKRSQINQKTEKHEAIKQINPGKGMSKAY